MCRSECSVADAPARALTALEHPVRRVISQRPARVPQRPPQRLATAPWDALGHLHLVEPQPHEGVGRGRQLLELPAALTHHLDQLAARVDPALRRREQLRGAGPGRDVEGHQGPVAVRAQPREDLIELLVRDGARHPDGHGRPIEPAPLVAVGVHRVAVRMCPPLAPSPVQGRVQHRAGTGVTVKIVEASQHRFAVRAHRRRIRPVPGRCCPLAGRCGLFPIAPVRPRRLAGDLQPAAEIPRLDPCRPVPADTQGPAEPEPPQQIEPIGAGRGRRAARSLQVPQERRHRLDHRPVGVHQPDRIPPVTGGHHPTDLRHHQARQICPRLLHG